MTSGGPFFGGILRSSPAGRRVFPRWIVLSLLSLVLPDQRSLSQDSGAIPYTEKASSQNHRYSIVVAGKWCDDVPCGTQHVRLLRGPHRQVWTKGIRNLSAMPIVSNLGDVAIATGSRVTLYGHSGRRKGVFKAPEGFQTDLFEMFQAYATSGRRYYVIIGAAPDSLAIVTLSDSAREVHREPLSVVHPCLKNAIRTYKDKVIIFDCGGYEDRDNGRACCVFNEDGVLIWEYDEQRQGRVRDKEWEVSFNTRKGMLTIVDGEKRESVVVDTLR